MLTGWLAFCGAGPAGHPGAPLLPLMYIGANLAFNIAALNLVRSVGNVITSLVRGRGSWQWQPAWQGDDGEIGWSRREGPPVWPKPMACN